MNRKKAIEYLERKDKIREPVKVVKKIKYTKKEEAKIKKVMKEGKIFGDPIAEVQW